MDVIMGDRLTSAVAFVGQKFVSDWADADWVAVEDSTLMLTLHVLTGVAVIWFNIYT